MRAAVLDDDPKFLHSFSADLQSWARRHGFTLEIQTFSSVTALLAAIERTEFSAIFLDIMIGEDFRAGMDAAHAIRNSGFGRPLIFTSSAMEFGVESYEVEATDYLLKPIDPDRLDHCLSITARAHEPADATLFLQTTDGLRRIPSSDVLYVHSAGNYVSLVTRTGSIRVRDTFTHMLERLPADFVRCRRTDAVNIAFVICLYKNEVELEGGERIPISRSCLDGVRQAFRQYQLGSC